jgi:hypothetical protein
MTKKPSLMSSAKQQLADKESFIYNSKGMKGERCEGGNAKSDDYKKVSLYMPRDLWVDYKEYELAEAKKGNDVSINGLAIEFFNKLLRG